MLVTLDKRSLWFCTGKASVLQTLRSVIWELSRQERIIAEALAWAGKTFEEERRGGRRGEKGGKGGGVVERRWRKETECLSQSPKYTYPTLKILKWNLAFFFFFTRMCMYILFLIKNTHRWAGPQCMWVRKPGFIVTKQQESQEKLLPPPTHTLLFLKWCSLFCIQKFFEF